MVFDPLILELRGNSLDDGPGIRTVVFFKGCPLRCAWCHNPESRHSRAELSFDPSLCVHSGECFPRCPEGALSLASSGRVDRSRCTLCFDCVEACPSGALSRVGTPMSVDEIVARVRRDLPFFAVSGGGVTLSGGEPAMFPELAGRLARALRELGVHVLLETCGHFDLPRFDRLMYPHLNAIYFDLKLFDEARHEALCGTGNRRILENFAALHRRHLEGGVELLPRIPLVPGMTAADENLAALAAYLRGHGVRRLGLLPYNPLWPEKLSKLGQAPPRAPGLEAWMSREELARCRAHFEGLELV